MLLRTLIGLLQAFQQEMDAAGVADTDQVVMVDTSVLDLGVPDDEPAAGAFVVNARLSVSGQEGNVVIEI